MERKPKQIRRKKIVQTKVNSMLMQSNGKISREKKTLGVLELKFIDGKALPISTKDTRHFKAFVRELDPRFLFYSAA